MNIILLRKMVSGVARTYKEKGEGKSFTYVANTFQTFLNEAIN